MKPASWLLLFMLAATGLFAQTPPGVEVAPEDMGMRIKLPAPWTEFDPAMVGFVVQFAENRFGKAAMQKFQPKGLYVRGEVKGLDLLRGPTMIILTAKDLTTPASLIEGVPIYAERLKISMSSKLRDFYLELAPFRITAEPEFGGLSLNSTTKLPDGTPLTAKAACLPTRDQTILFIYVSPASVFDEVNTEITTALKAVQLDPGLAWSEAEKKTLLQAAPGISMKPASEQYGEIISKAQRLLDRRSLTESAEAFAQAAEFARKIVERKTADADPWQRRVCAALIGQADALRQTPDHQSALPMLEAALAIIHHPTRDTSQEAAWWDIHRRVLAIKADVLRRKDKAQAVLVRQSLLTMFRQGLEKGFGTVATWRDAAAKTKDQAYDLKELKRSSEALATAKEGLKLAQIAVEKNSSPTDTSPAYELASCWRCLADMQEWHGDLMSARASHLEALQRHEKLTENVVMAWGPHGNLYSGFRYYGLFLSRHRDICTPEEELAAFEKSVKIAESLVSAALFPDADKGNLSDCRNKLASARMRVANLTDGGAMQRRRDALSAAMKSGDDALAGKRYADAVPHFRKAVELASKLAKEDTVMEPGEWARLHCVTLEKLAKSLNGTPRFREGEAPAAEAVRLWKETPHSPERERAWWDAGRAAMQTQVEVVQRWDKPRTMPMREQWVAHLLSGADKQYGVPYTWQTAAWQLRELACHCQAQKEIPEALRLITDSVSWARRGVAAKPLDNPMNADLFYGLRAMAEIELQSGRFTEAIAHLQEAVLVMKTILGREGARAEWPGDLLEVRRRLAEVACQHPADAQATGMDSVAAWTAYLEAAGKMAAEGKLSADKTQRLAKDRQRGSP